MMGERIKKRKHKSVIHSNAATDLGVIFIKWCHFSEIQLISVVNTQEEAEKISSVAPETVIVKESPEFELQLRNACEKFKPTCGFDFCGGPTAGAIFNSLEPESEFFLMSGTNDLSGLNPSEFIFKEKTLLGLQFKSWFDELSLIQRTKYFSKIQKVNFVFSSCLTNIYPISQFKEGIRNYQSLGANLFHFACDLQNNSTHANEDIFSQYISESLKSRIHSLPSYPWSGTEYPLKLISEGIYKGEIINDKPIGMGILLSENSYYTGSFTNGQKNGKGRLITEDFWYEGDFLNGICEGQGKMTTFEGHSQEGTFLNGKISGLGVEILATGEKYEGEFLHGARNGRGEIFFEGIKFEGTFKEGLAHGEGLVKFEDGSVFYGIYVDGIGQGELKKTDGSILHGSLCGSKFVEKGKN